MVESPAFQRKQQDIFHGKWKIEELLEFSFTTSINSAMTYNPVHDAFPRRQQAGNKLAESFKDGAVAANLNDEFDYAS